MRTSRACSVEGCTRRHNANGYCAMHEMRLKRWGDVNNPGRLVRSDGTCSVNGCARKHVAKGMCGMHYQRHRKTGSVELPDALTCARCDAEFTRPYKGNPATIRFCSHECRYAQQLEDARADKDARRIAAKKWRTDNPEKFKANILRRRSRKRGADSKSVTGKDLARLIQRFDGLCAYCGESPYEHLDHVTPLARGGRHAIGNLLPACSTCNLTKGARLVSEWRHKRPLPRRFRLVKSA